MAFMNNTDEPDPTSQMLPLTKPMKTIWPAAGELVGKLRGQYPHNDDQLDKDFQAWLGEQRKRIRNWEAVSLKKMKTNSLISSWKETMLFSRRAILRSMTSSN